MIFNTLDELKEAILKHHKGGIAYGNPPEIDAFFSHPRSPRVTLEKCKEIVDTYLSQFDYTNVGIILGVDSDAVHYAENVNLEYVYLLSKGVRFQGSIDEQEYVFLIELKNGTFDVFNTDINTLPYSTLLSFN